MSRQTHARTHARTHRRVRKTHSKTHRHAHTHTHPFDPHGLSYRPVPALLSYAFSGVNIYMYILYRYVCMRMRVTGTAMTSACLSATIAASIQSPFYNMVQATTGRRSVWTPLLRPTGRSGWTNVTRAQRAKKILSFLAVDSQGIFHSEFGRSGRRCYDHPVGVQTPQQRPPGRSCIIKRTCMRPHPHVIYIY